MLVIPKLIKVLLFNTYLYFPCWQNLKFSIRLEIPMFSGLSCAVYSSQHIQSSMHVHGHFDSEKDTGDFQSITCISCFLDFNFKLWN